jgi:hypothetical protein
LIWDLVIGIYLVNTYLLFLVPLIQLIGQASAQSPQSVHFAASIAYLSSSWLIAFDGQVPSHTPHPAHASLSILKAI